MNKFANQVHSRLLNRVPKEHPNIVQNEVRDGEPMSTWPVTTMSKSVKTPNRCEARYLNSISSKLRHRKNYISCDRLPAKNTIAQAPVRRLMPYHVCFFFFYWSADDHLRFTDLHRSSSTSIHIHSVASEETNYRTSMRHVEPQGKQIFV